MSITLNNYQTVFANLSGQLKPLGDLQDRTLSRLAHDFSEEIRIIGEGGAELEKENSTLKIGVVGRVKAGKSSFLNSLFFDGESVLPRASTPMTAGLTALKYGESNLFEVEYYNTSEWKVFEDQDKEYKSILDELRSSDPGASDEQLINRFGLPDTIVSAHELVSNCSRKALSNILPESKKETRSFENINDLQDVLNNYVGAEGQYTPITKCLTITLNDPRLKGIQIVDTPGVNDPVVSRELRTREFLRGCHGVFFLSYSGSFFDSTDVSFLVRRIGSQGIGQVVLIASKFDSVLQDVGQKFFDDLGGAIDDCKKKLKDHFHSNISKSEYKGSDPVLDFSSGIGYSIFKKDSHNWDAMESHVVGQMRKLYPSFFDSESNIKETFRDLAQIDDIRKDYLEGIFNKKKTEIIQNKVDAYFSNAEDRINSLAAQTKARLSEFIEVLETGDMGALKQQKETVKTVISDIRSDLGAISLRAREIAERNMKECLNEYTFMWNGRMPIVRVSDETFRRVSTFLEGNRTFQCDYDMVDIVTLQEDLERTLRKSLTCLNDLWLSKTRELYNLISKTISEIIAKNESKDDSGSFNGHMLRNELDMIIDNIRNNCTLDLSTIQARFHTNLLTSLTGKDKVKYEYGIMNEDEARTAIIKASKECINSIKIIVNSQIEALQSEVRDMMKHAMNRSIDVVVDKKEMFISEISSRLEEALSNLETSLQTKENTLREAVGFQTILNNLKLS